MNEIETIIKNQKKITDSLLKAIKEPIGEADMSEKDQFEGEHFDPEDDRSANDYE